MQMIKQTIFMRLLREVVTITHGNFCYQTIWYWLDYSSFLHLLMKDQLPVTAFFHFEDRSNMSLNYLRIVSDWPISSYLISGKSCLNLRSTFVAPARRRLVLWSLGVKQRILLHYWFICFSVNSRCCPDLSSSELFDTFFWIYSFLKANLINW